MTDKALTAIALLLMAATIGVLIAPSCRHRLLERGEASPTMLRITTRCAALALLPLSLGLAGAIYVAIGHSLGSEALGLPILLLGIWYAWPCCCGRGWHFHSEPAPIAVVSPHIRSGKVWRK